MKKLILIIVLFLLPVAAFAADQVLEDPRWSLELKGGTFAPALDNWATYYGKKDMPSYGGALAFKPIRWIEVGVEATLMSDEGQSYAPGHGTLSGNVTYKLYPVNVFVLARGVISEGQWLVPYIGGGFTRMYYEQTIEGQDAISGYVDGYHVRGGLQLLLDAMDQRAANDMFKDYGVFHTYLFFEAERTKAKIDAIDIGGTSYMMGLLFEF